MSAPENGEVIESTAVEEPVPAVPDLGALVPTGGTTLAVTPQAQASELVERLDVIKQAQQQAMKPEVDYGVIPGTGSKPTLLKPGAEKLSVLFQLDVQIINEKDWGPDDHLTVTAKATAFHAPTGTRLGYGEGICTTREKKYAYRTQNRTCPHCGKEAVIKGKKEYGGGWLCFKKKDGCGAKWDDGDQAIEGQVVGEIPNPDLPDLWNTVVKMAEKRARVDVVLAVTGASALFTQDVEDSQGQPFDEHAGSEALHRASAEAAKPKIPGGKALEICESIKRLKLTYADVHMMLGASGANGLEGDTSFDFIRKAVEGLNLDQAVKFEAKLEAAAQDASAEAGQGDRQG